MIERRNDGGGGNGLYEPLFGQGGGGGSSSAQQQQQQQQRAIGALDDSLVVQGNVSWANEGEQQQQVSISSDVSNIEGVGWNDTAEV
jgi:hypothetical protein